MKKETKHPNYLKANILFLLMDSMVLGSYFGFEALSKIQVSILSKDPEIIVNEVSFHSFMLFFLIIFHLIIVIGAHSPISKKPYIDTYYKATLLISFGLTFFSGYFISIYVENKLENAGYHFCENLSYDKAYRSTHYVWRAKGLECE